MNLSTILVLFTVFNSATLILISWLLLTKYKGKKPSKLAQKLSKIINNGLTYQSRLQFLITKRAIEDAIDNDEPHACPHSYKMNILNKEPGRLPKFRLSSEEDYGVVFPTKDEDKANPSWIKTTINSSVNLFPVKDRNLPFPKEVMDNKTFEAWEDNNVDKIYNSFEHTFIGLQSYDISSDKGISLMSFNGLGWHFMKKINRDSDDNKSNNDDPLKTYEKELESAQYMIDLSILGQFPVRQGFVRYGCIAYYNDKYDIIGIFASHYKELYTPASDKAKWEHAKWILRVTIATVSTIKCHLLESHEIIAHAFVIATRENLHFDHPLRRFLKPFCFRTIYINHSAAQNLVGKKQLVHRAWAFDYEQVIGILKALNGSYKFDLHKNRFKTNGMTDVPDEHFPIQTDMNEYWEITHQFVANYLKIYYKDDEALNVDKYIPDWYSKLCKGLKLDKDNDPLCELTLDNVTDMICNKIFNGSAWHQYVGNTIQEYLKRPNWFGSKICDNLSTQSDIQSYIQAITVGLLTGLPMPNIINNWKFILLEDDKYSQTRKVFDDWQNELKAMSLRVIKRNETRRMPILFCEPSTLDCSVGV
mmetsp:Transcript_27376/g.24205  ORF Transcript_27376/g.24205 Transcript_27376/m.24205 type:complete len:589 (-) Transcript_27376:56-1822(-)